MKAAVLMQPARSLKKTARQGVLLLAGLLAAQMGLLAWLGPDPGDAGAAASGIAEQLLGSLRDVIGNELFMKADTAFHRGAEHVQNEALADHPFRRLRDTVHPTGHVHLGGTSVKEILPWLEMAIAIDPHHVDSYLVAAFWLSTDLQRPDLAETVLRKAAEDNPESIEVCLEYARLLLHQGRISEATVQLDRGLALSAGDPDLMESGAALDRAAILNYRALVHEIQDEPDAAVLCLEEILRLFPDRQGIPDRIREIRAGGKAKGLEDFMQRFMRLDVEEQHEKMHHRESHMFGGCTGDDHDHEDHEADVEGDPY